MRSLVADFTYFMVFASDQTEFLGDDQGKRDAAQLKRANRKLTINNTRNEEDKRVFLKSGDGSQNHSQSSTLCKPCAASYEIAGG